MNKMWVIPVLTLFSILFVGCPNPQSSNTGDLVISLTPSMEKGAKTLLPAIDMNISTYDASGAGPSGASFSQTNVGTSVTVNALVQGSWLITVNGKNDAGTVIGTGTASATIIAGQTANASVTVTPLTGNGTLNLAVSWTSGLITTPSVTGTLTPIGGSSSDITFTPGTNSATYNSGANLTAGYYALSIILKDGTSTVWGGVESVRIVSANATTGSFALTSTDITNFNGNVSFTVTPAMNSPITITLTGQQSPLPLGASMTVVATPSSSLSSYLWFLNGSAINGQTSASCPVGSGLSAGNYRLDVVGIQGSILASSHCTFRIQVIPVWQTFGSLGSVANQFHSPEGIAVDSSDRIYVVDYLNSRIVRMDDLNGANWKTFGGPGSGSNQFSSPQGMAVDATGHIYVADKDNNRIVCMDDMNGTNWVALTGFTLPVGIAVSSSGKIYVVNSGNGTIMSVDNMTGTNRTTFGSSGGGANQFGSPIGIALDASERIYIGDFNNCRIVRIDDMIGTNWKTFGSAGSGIGNFQYMWGIAVDASGRIYVNDWNNRIVRMDDMDGTNWTSFGSSGTGINQFDYLGGLTVAASGSYVTLCDTNNHRIVRLVMP